ncbi:MAG: hypothetical protein AAF657_31605 [Acidobacteriota bacterium]
MTCLALLWWGTLVLESYGWTLFVLLPVALGGAIGFLVEKASEGLAVGLAVVAFSVSGMLVLGFEGLICILMAAPLVLVLALIGAALARWVLPRSHGGKTLILLFAALPFLMAFEKEVAPEPPLYSVRTAVTIDAPPDVVWEQVVSFSEIPPPEDWIFKTGLAYPIHARIEGTGVGAIRYCEFSTGAFVEPIEVWDAPRLLRFAVTENPPPMEEWNPFAETHPPHLDQFLVSRRGQFLLEPLPGGGTRLEGTTWYQHGLWPATYWRWWSDAIIHRIHSRVLDHVGRLAESRTRAASSPPDASLDSTGPEDRRSRLVDL